MTKDKEKILENILWSIALPGFPQLLNRQYLKGFGFIALEIIINVQAKFNYAILLSFHGEVKQALEVTNFQWLMFYPCLYFYAMWDAYKAAGKQSSFMYLPFVFSAYFVTVGLIFSPKITIFGKLLGPVWLPMLFVIPGVLVGFIIKILLQFIFKKSLST
ncbi:hypothetical protein [Niallia endozanthoxylica]|uniref:Uncharacterized protein n=1 Tax=Niallia endozanthoxylica TaxID=2036016 RepID=A0A5J5HRU6_9BACI|nr:hypothetical protein [Niallia endozanthoxylica]KAA9023840.1 hypothetical protein F4V44_11915 [Niallia endozanthoxylica]